MTITLLRDVTVVSERVTIRYSPRSVSEGRHAQEATDHADGMVEKI
jgi:hypothetical protein